MEKIAYGRTGHMSSRILFGAAAIGGMRPEKADSVLQMVMDAGINHIDVAASYGDAELRLAPFLQDHRKDFFLATKTGDRTYDGAKASIERSLERMQVEQIDVIQFHNLAKDNEWNTVMEAGGALEAAIEAREQGLVRFIGVTGHGTRIAEMHLKSLAKFEFASVLLPYSHMSMQDDQYATEFEELYTLCMDKGIAVQTIKAIAKRRWQEGDESPKFSWYEPIREDDALTRAVHWVLSRPGIFLNSSSDATLLPKIIKAANEFDADNVGNLNAEVEADVSRQELEPLFERDVQDDVR
ncbi:MAG: aldo/keto reductase [Pseudomonadales bacterium]|jgi:aryl-alcohol dehydrogenase-like predicted oxidoreductase